MNSASVRVFIGLGSNLENPVAQIKQALEALAMLEQSDLITCSPLYQSKPMGPVDQSDFVNAVAEIKTQLSPIALLEALQAIESQQGRLRDKTRWGPRTLDLDLLLYAEKTINAERLIVPHPGIHQRSFVLYPLYQLDPELMIPGQGQIKDLLDAIDTSDLKKL